MILQDLGVSLCTYGENKGKYTGGASFSSPKGKVEIRLNEELSKRVLAAVADELIATTQEIAGHLAADTIEAVDKLGIEYGSSELTSQI